MERIHAMACSIYCFELLTTRVRAGMNCVAASQECQSGVFDFVYTVHVDARDIYNWNRV